MKKRMTLVILLVCVPAGGAAWYFWSTFTPLDENDYATVTGTLKSVEPGGTYKSPHLDIYTRESPLRFRVGSPSLQHSFDQQSFEKHTHRAGSEVELKVEKAQLAKPSLPPIDPKETVYVYGLRDDNAVYSTLAGYEKWREQNIGYALIMAIFFSVVSVFCVGAALLSSGAKTPAINEGEAAAMRERFLSRVYRHTQCGGQTTVSGDDYVNLECPFRPVQRTYCAVCRRFVPLDTVQWVDSGQSITEYRRQVFFSVPWTRRLWLVCMGNAYEGALNLGLDRHGLPIDPAAEPSNRAAASS
jgi:hypothetical protein